MNIEKATEAQKIYFYKTKVIKECTSLVKSLSYSFSEEELKDIFYENTLSINPEQVKKTIEALKSVKIEPEYKEQLKKGLDNVLQDYSIDKYEIKVTGLSKEDLRSFYKNLISLSTKYKVKLPLEEVKVYLIDTPLEEEEVEKTEATISPLEEECMIANTTANIAVPNVSINTRTDDNKSNLINRKKNN